MSDFKPGLEGVVAFETEIAEPDREGGALRYRGVDIEDLVGQVSYGHVWGLLVDNSFTPGLPPAEPYPIPVRSGDIRVDVQSALAMLAPAKGMRPLLDISDEQARDDLARASVMTLSFVAQSARGTGLPAIPQERVEESDNIVERFMIRWRGDPDPRHVEEVERIGDATTYVRAELDKGERLMGFGHRVYRAEDPRARVLRRTAKELDAPRYEVAAALEEAALAELHARRPDRVLATNVEYWAAIVLDFAEVPSHMFTAMFTCARTAGWSAHILEQKGTGRLIRPSARYVGPKARPVKEVPGAEGVIGEI